MRKRGIRSYISPIVSVDEKKGKKKKKVKKKKEKTQKVTLIQRDNRTATCQTDSFVKIVRTLYNDPKSADVIVRFVNYEPVRTFYCHTLVLFNHSQFLKRMFEEKKFVTTNLKEETDKVLIEIDNLLPKLKLTPLEFEIMLKYMYHGDFERPPKEKALRWLHLSKTFEIRNMTDMILSFLGTFFELQDCLNIIEVCRKKGHKNMYGVCIQVIEVYDVLVFQKTEEYLKLSLPTMKYFARDGRLGITEIEIFNCCKKYCCQKWNDPEFLKDNFQEEEEEGKKKSQHYTSEKDMFQKEFETYIRYPLIPPEDFCKIIEIGNPDWVSVNYMMECYQFNSSDKIALSLQASLGLRGQAREYPPVSKFKGSTILSPKHQGIVYKWYLKERGNPKKRKFELLYKGSRDGFQGEEFHKKCDDQGPTMSVIKSTDGDIFGGYAHISWQSTPSRYAKDTEAWLWHIKSKGKVDPFKCTTKENTNNHVYHYQFYGPTFGGNFDLFVAQQMETQNSYTNVSHSYDVPSGKSKNLSSSYNYKVEEIEVYGVKK